MSEPRERSPQTRQFTGAKSTHKKKECKIVKRAVNPIDKPNKQVLPTEIPNSRKMETLNEPKTSFSTKDRDEDSSKDHLNESQQDRLARTGQQTQFWQKRPSYMDYKKTTDVIKESVKQPSLGHT